MNKTPQWADERRQASVREHAPDAAKARPGCHSRPLGAPQSERQTWRVSFCAKQGMTGEVMERARPAVCAGRAELPSGPFFKWRKRQTDTKAMYKEAWGERNETEQTEEKKVLATRARVPILGIVLGGTAALRPPIGAGGPHFFCRGGRLADTRNRSSEKPAAAREC